MVLCLPLILITIKKLKEIKKPIQPALLFESIKIILPKITIVNKKNLPLAVRLLKNGIKNTKIAAHKIPDKLFVGTKKKSYNLVSYIKD